VSTTSVLLVHGLGSTFEQNWQQPGWVEVLEADGLTPRPVRLPGHGGARLDHSGADAVLAAAGEREGTGEGPVAAVGFSAGAIALLTAAAAEPGRFSRIALLGIGDHVLHPEPEAVRPLVDSLRGPAEPEDVGARTFWRLVRRSGNDRHQVAAFLESAPLGVDAGRLARIGCPVLVAVGDRDAALPAAELVGALPDARLVVLPGVDHFATVSALAAFDAVTHFLAA
jgi:pimeloyl-ACP methyl ester carboxylesterase